MFSTSSTLRHIQPRTGSLEARIQAIEADNQRIVGMCVGGSAMTAPKSTIVSSHSLDSRVLCTCLRHYLLVQVENQDSYVKYVECRRGTIYIVQSGP